GVDVAGLCFAAGGTATPALWLIGVFLCGKGSSAATGGASVDGRGGSQSGAVSICVVPEAMLPSSPRRRGRETNFRPAAAHNPARAGDARQQMSAEYRTR